MVDRIGFVGLGHMGNPMSAHIAASGAPLTVYDIDPALTRAHAAEIGATPAADLAELGRNSDVVVTMLPTGQVVRQAVLEQGLADTLAKGSLIIDMSSSVPTGSVTLHDELEKRGIGFIDAPVSGAVPRAKTATLAIMVGASDEAQFARAEPILKLMGDRIFRTGGVGTGHAMKALNNYVAAAGFAAASEALILGEKFGLNPETALDIINVSTGRNFSTEATLKTEVLTRAFKSGFGLALLTKDVKIAADLSESLDAGLPLVAETSAWWDRALAELGAEKDHTEAFTVWEATART
ncbi:NAD(P)-dependent oxidoreductase [Amorphus sp. 3PC139-8]|uniref:NAD(P)-dependent oxidoreductase n=1 Tax=Amorphus sp. 3PC139-8 TaxID=2735676 RepID=UPI00345CC26D